MGLYPKEIVTQLHKRTWTSPFIAVLFVVGEAGAVQCQAWESGEVTQAGAHSGALTSD